MKRNSYFLICLIQVAFSVNLLGQSIVKPAQNNAIFPPQYAMIGEFVGGKLYTSYQNRILAQDVDRLVEPFRNLTEDRCWQSEFWGKWFTLVTYCYKPAAELKKILNDAFAGLIASQTTEIAKSSLK